MSAALTPEQLSRLLAVRDLTDPAEGPHALQLLIRLAVDALLAAWDCQVWMVRGPRVVPLADNYDRLRYPPEAVTRDARYTRYVDGGHVLRGHTTAMIPAALEGLASKALDDVLVICPGIAYRRDSIDRLHTDTPHQLDLWRISRDPLGAAMAEMMELLAGALVPGRPWRWEPRVHPYTLDGRQVDIRDAEGAWVEVWECGPAHPEVLAGAGLANCSGLALGMGLDRLLMLRKNIPDIRLLRSTDRRVAAQMLDLEPYRRVSDLPAIRRDISVAIGADDDVETIGDRVREALLEEAEVLEGVTILSETPYDELPDAARRRLGMTPDQKNVLVRLDIRPFGRSLTDADANLLRDRIYGAVHMGSVAQWALQPSTGRR